MQDPHPGVFDRHEGHSDTPKSCCQLRCTLLMTQKSEKSYAYRSFTFVCQLYCCSSKHNNNKALRITFNSCKTVSTSSMALATVNIDKIIKVTSVSSYVSAVCWYIFTSGSCPPAHVKNARTWFPTSCYTHLQRRITYSLHSSKLHVGL